MPFSNMDIFLLPLMNTSFAADYTDSKIICGICAICGHLNSRSELKKHFGKFLNIKVTSYQL